MLFVILVTAMLVTGSVDASMTSVFGGSSRSSREESTSGNSRAASVFKAQKIERQDSSDDDDQREDKGQSQGSSSGNGRASSVFGSSRSRASSSGEASEGSTPKRYSRASSVFTGRSSAPVQDKEEDTAASSEKAEETKQVAEVKEEDLKEDYSSREFLWPVEKGRITSFYGWRTTKRFHDGIDIAAPSGTKIFAVKDGTVVYSSGKISGYGNMVVIKHKGKLYSVYAHNKTNKVSKGDRVRKGDVIALLGNSGKSRGPHLHFEMRKGKYSVDPMKYYSYKLSKKKGFVHEFK